jgi:uncharacterized protein (TIGR03435 family)
MWRLSIALALTVTAIGQTATPPSFEVAEIKINNSGPGDSRGDIANGRLYITNASLRNLIAEAWTTTVDGVRGPSWLDDERVDVVAKTTSAQTPDATVRLMLQNLLKDRMKLVTHMEQREESAWALSVWKGQPKLEPSEMPARPEDASCSLHTDAAGRHLTCEHLTMALFAHKLSKLAPDYADKQVVDQAGLTGAWKLKLDWVPQKQAETEGGDTLYMALQSQLGLQLENKKLPVQVLVVDSIERSPTEN